MAVRCVQGKDRECVIVSMVRSNEDGCAGALWCDVARLNVALTRAKVRTHSLLGSSLTLSTDCRPICQPVVAPTSLC